MDIRKEEKKKGRKDGTKEGRYEGSKKRRNVNMHQEFRKSLVMKLNFTN